VTTAPAPERLGDYEILGELGRGAMGVVYRARKTALPDREVALKEVPVGANDAARERRQREGRALSRIHSLHIVQLHDVFEVPERGSLCIVMERLEPETLRDRMTAAGGPMPVDAVVEVLDGVLDALEATHGALDETGKPLPIVHRDLKPENVGYQKWRGGEIVKVMDFGVARAAEGPDRIARAIGTLHAYTPAYASPEVMLGQLAAPSSDLWSVGMILWEMLAGRHPFADAKGSVQSPMQALVQNQGVTPPLPAHLLPRIPEALVDLQRDLCAHDPELRPTAKEARQRLAAVVVPGRPSGASASRPVTVRPSSAPVTTGGGRGASGPTVREVPEGQRAGGSGAGKIVLVVVAALVLVAGGIGIGWVALGGSRDGPSPGAPLPGAPLPGSPFGAAPGDVPVASPAPNECPELASYDPAVAALPIPELEQRLRTSGVMMPSMVEKSLAGMRAQLAVYRAEKRDCMYRTMLVAQVGSLAAMARQIPGGWAQGRTAADLSNLFKTVALREPWTLAEREDVLSQVERNVIASLRVEGEGDREYWRHMYYGLLLQCEATDEALASLNAPREENNCTRFRPTRALTPVPSNRP